VLNGVTVTGKIGGGGVRSSGPCNVQRHPSPRAHRKDRLFFVAGLQFGLIKRKNNSVPRQCKTSQQKERASRRNRLPWGASGHRWSPLQQETSPQQPTDGKQTGKKENRTHTGPTTQEHERPEQPADKRVCATRWQAHTPMSGTPRHGKGEKRKVASFVTSVDANAVPLVVGQGSFGWLLACVRSGLVSMSADTRGKLKSEQYSEQAKSKH